MMPRDAHLSDSCTFNHGGFFSILDDSYSDLLEQMIMHNITNEYYVQNTMHNIMHNIAV